MSDELGTLSHVRVLEGRLLVHATADPDVHHLQESLRGVHMPGVRRQAEPAPVLASEARVVNCSSSCLTRDHATWGECVRSKGLQVSPAINEAYGTRQRAWDRELDNYESAVRQGLEPAGTKQHLIDKAVKEADAA